LKINLNDKWKKQKTNSRISSLGRIYESVNWLFGEGNNVKNDMTLNMSKSLK
jgi:hypothetical protein